LAFARQERGSDWELVCDGFSKLGGEPEDRTFAGFALKPNLPFHQDHDLLRNHEAFEIAAL
jgi:hypothetical protein